MFVNYLDNLKCYTNMIMSAFSTRYTSIKNINMAHEHKKIFQFKIKNNNHTIQYLKSDDKNIIKKSKVLFEFALKKIDYDFDSHIQKELVKDINSINIIQRIIGSDVDHKTIPIIICNDLCMKYHELLTVGKKYEIKNFVYAHNSKSIVISKETIIKLIDEFEYASGNNICVTTNNETPNHQLSMYNYIQHFK